MLGFEISCTKLTRIEYLNTKKRSRSKIIMNYKREVFDDKKKKLGGVQVHKRRERHSQQQTADFPEKISPRKSGYCTLAFSLSNHRGFQKLLYPFTRQQFSEVSHSFFSSVLLSLFTEQYQTHPNEWFSKEETKLLLLMKPPQHHFHTTSKLSSQLQKKKKKSPNFSASNDGSESIKGNIAYACFLSPYRTYNKWMGPFLTP